MNCIIVDDELIARQGLEQYVTKVSELNLVGSYSNAIEAGKALRKEQIDLMILDIQMPNLTGLDFLKSLKKQAPLTILHTAYPNFALEGYQLDVLDYLVKPVTFDRFYQAVTKAMEYFKLKNGSNSHETSDFIFIKADKRYEKVLYSEILYIEAMQNYSVVQTVNTKLITPMSLKSMEEILPKSLFKRVQRSFIVSVNQISAFEGNQVKVGNQMITITKEVKVELINRLMPGS
ncbi:MAG: two-component system LytT family response regulator [Cyclobacteriaceae bacterium]|jgi:two-component system LytT family response regulator